MTTYIKGFLIDPEAQSITDITIEKSERYDSKMYKRLAGFDCIDIVQINEHNHLIVDDMGLYREGSRIFNISGQNIAGKALVFGVNFAGETVSVTMPIEEVQQMVHWTDLEFSHMEASEGLVDHPIFGQMWQISHVAKFRERSK